jgi:hypothetical protein
MFLVIGSDPIRFRRAMLPAIVEKASFSVAIPTLYALERVTVTWVGFAAMDATWLVLFIIAYVRTIGLFFARNADVANGVFHGVPLFAMNDSPQLSHSRGPPSSQGGTSYDAKQCWHWTITRLYVAMIISLPLSWTSLAQLLPNSGVRHRFCDY